MPNSSNMWRARQGSAVALLEPMPDDRYPESFRLRAGQIGIVGLPAIQQGGDQWVWVRWYDGMEMQSHRANELTLVRG